MLETSGDPQIQNKKMTINVPTWIPWNVEKVSVKLVCPTPGFNWQIEQVKLKRSAKRKAKRNYFFRYTTQN